MYIRRKVFSSYSDYDLIDAIQERAFSEGYMQRMFDEDAEDNKAGKVLTGIGAAGALGAAGYAGKTVYDTHKFKNALTTSRDKAWAKIHQAEKAGGALDKKTYDKYLQAAIDDGFKPELAESTMKKRLIERDVRLAATRDIELGKKLAKEARNAKLKKIGLYGGIPAAALLAGGAYL